MLGAGGLHAHPAGDRKAVRVIGDADTQPSELVAPFREIRDRLAAVAPRRMHLQIAEIAARRNDRRIKRRVQRDPHRVATEIGTAEAAALLYFTPLRRCRDRRLNGGRLSGPHEFRDDALARYAHERHIPQDPFLDQVHDRSIGSRSERFRGTLVAELAPLRTLKNRKVVQEARGDDIHVLVNLFPQAPLFPPHVGSHLHTRQET